MKKLPFNCKYKLAEVAGLPTGQIAREVKAKRCFYFEKNVDFLI